MLQREKLMLFLRRKVDVIKLNKQYFKGSNHPNLAFHRKVMSAREELPGLKHKISFIIESLTSRVAKVFVISAGLV